MQYLQYYYAAKKSNPVGLLLGHITTETFSKLPWQQLIIFRLSLSLQSALSVADRISELEKQQKYSYLDPNKKHKVPDPTLKAIQKKALLSFYERHQQNSAANKNPWRSEPQLAQSQQPLSVPKIPSPKVKVSLPSRRASSASDYASANNSKRSSLASSLESKTTDHIGTYYFKYEVLCAKITILIFKIIIWKLSQTFLNSRPKLKNKPKNQ